MFLSWFKNNNYKNSNVKFENNFKQFYNKLKQINLKFENNFK